MSRFSRSGGAEDDIHQVDLYRARCKKSISSSQSRSWGVEIAVGLTVTTTKKNKRPSLRTKLNNEVPPDCL